MGDEKENIHSFIMGQDRKKNRELIVKEKLLKMWLQDSSETSAESMRDSFPKRLRPCEEAFKSQCRVNEKTVEEQDPLTKDVEKSNVVNGAISLLDAQVLGLNVKGGNLKVGLALTVVVAVCSVVSIVALLLLDAVVNQTLYSFGLQFSYDWATPYWIAIRTTLGMLYAMIIAVALFQAYLLRRSRLLKGENEKWKNYSLSDGSTIRMKTVVKGIRHLEEHEIDSHQAYSIETENIIEVIES